MRFRLFTFIFFILLVVAVCSAALDNYFVNRERLAFIDGELDEVAGLLIHSNLIDEASRELDQLENVEKLITKELGITRLGKFFVMRDLHGRVLFRSTSARLFPISDIATDPRRLTLRAGGDIARILNIPVPKSSHSEPLTLQVGFLLKEELLLNPVFSSRDMLEVFSLVLIGMALAIGMIRRFLRPLRELSHEVAEIAALSASASVLPPMRLGKWAKFAAAEGNRDEYHELVKGLDTLIGRVNRGYEVSRVWSYQMAHELKTPMAILAAEVALGRAKNQIAAEIADTVEREIQVASDTVSAFLLWAEVESGVARKDLHVIGLGSVLETLVKRVQSRGADRLRLTIHADDKVALTPAYLEIVLNNLVANALLYSPPESEVHIELFGSRIEVSDAGAGMPDEVLARVGQPFNRGVPRAGQREAGHGFETPVRRSHGLGLATVLAISRVFGWRVEFQRRQDRTVVSLDLGGDRLA